MNADAATAHGIVDYAHRTAFTDMLPPFFREVLSRYALSAASHPFMLTAAYLSRTTESWVLTTSCVQGDGPFHCFPTEEHMHFSKVFDSVLLPITVRCIPLTARYVCQNRNNAFNS